MALNLDFLESSDLVEETFKFWFKDNEHIRSPFPEYIHSQLKVLATDKFFKWAAAVHPDAKEEITDEVIAEKFEEFIFETALSLVQTEDEKITINYPFLPRTGDTIENAEKGKSKIIDRWFSEDKDYKLLNVKCKSVGSGEVWETQFQLPA